MAFSSLGSLGTDTTKGSSLTQVLTAAATAAVGELVVVDAVWDNEGTAGGETSQLSIEDSAGNTWTKIKEITSTGGAANDGVCLAKWYTVVTTQIDSGSDTITVTSTSARAGHAMAAHRYGIGTSSVEVADVQVNAANSGDPPGVTISGLTSRSYLWLHSGGEGRGSTWTKDADYTLRQDIETSGGSATTNVNLMTSDRIATLTGDTADAASSTDTRTAEILAAIYETAGGTTNNETVQVTADTVLAGADVFEATETGAATADTVLAGADVHEASRTGATTADTVLAGADVFEATEATTVTSAAVLAGVAEKTSGGTEHVKTGELAAGTTAAAADVFEATETGAMAADTLAAGADVFEATEVGATLADTLLAGVAEHVAAGGTTYSKTGELAAGATSSAADASEFVETGATYAGTLYVGSDVFEATESGLVAATALLAGVAAGQLIYVTGFFDQPSLNRTTPGSPSGASFDDGTPGGDLDGGGPTGAFFDPVTPGAG